LCWGKNSENSKNAD